MDSLHEDAFPIIPHESTGADCCGCIIVKVTGNDAELKCNESGVLSALFTLGFCGIWFR